MVEWLVAAVVGLVQGLLEWLPVSSEGSVALALTALDRDPDIATQFALFLHAGTGIAATVYYRDVLVDVLADVPDWRPKDAFEGETAELSFFGIATSVSVVVGLGGYLALETLVSAVAGGAFVALIGALLVGTGILMRTAETRGKAMRASRTHSMPSSSAPYRAWPSCPVCRARGRPSVHCCCVVTRGATRCDSPLYSRFRRPLARACSFCLTTDCQISTLGLRP